MTNVLLWDSGPPKFPQYGEVVYDVLALPEVNCPLYEPLIATDALAHSPIPPQKISPDEPDEATLQSRLISNKPFPESWNVPVLLALALAPLTPK